MDSRSSSLADVLERVLDKGVVIVGDIAVNIVDIELLTLRLRLFVASAQTAKEMGMDWWTGDPFFSPNHQHQVLEASHTRTAELERLRGRVAELERALESEERS
ncbi:gas vesicle protein [Actinophytocola sp.]|uniref:gas vesicle protein n=1 Tax=Actinophytocola sp. TaxID=1872138 RepID=UPI002ED658FF